jgi:MFS family permease
MLYMPYVVPFYKANGLGMKEVLLLQAVYSVSIVILEIPSGYFADVLGRKISLVIGAICGFAGFLTYSVSFGILGFLIAEIILGVGQSMISGADSAMLYDSLFELKKEDKYIKYEGRMTSIGNIAEATAAFVAFLPALISIRGPYVAQTFIAFLAIPAALMLIEPKRHKRIIKAGLKDILRIINESIIKRPELRKNILFSAITGTATLTMAWFAQDFFGEINLDLKLYSPIWAILNLSVGIVAMVAYRIEEKLKPTLSIIIIATLIPSGYLTLSFTHSYIGLFVILIFYLVRGYATPVLKDYIHRITSSEIRATVLSIRNFAIRLIFAITAPFLGWVTDSYSFTIALKMAALIFFILSGITAILFVKSVSSAHNEKLNPS